MIFAQIGIGKRVHILVEYDEKQQWGTSYCGWCGAVKTIPKEQVWSVYVCHKCRADYLRLQKEKVQDENNT